MITDMDEQRRREAEARELGEQVAALLTQIEALGAGPAIGDITIPGARIRRFDDGWEVTN
ncbi:hypothetical protein [Streptomyces sp. NPDC013489]|uniref:hypothetical protein n=1 Tax=Streptomyces sp. NPDC013489 TaxID=3155606 RepID=UPI0033FB8ECE